MFEIKVKVSDEEMKLYKDFLHYEENIRLSYDDPTLNAMIKEVKDKFQGSPDNETDLTIKWRR